MAQQRSIANELRSGSPLESVVQGRLESPVPSNPAVQGTPDILAQIRARALQRIECATLIARGAFAEDLVALGANENGKVVAFNEVLQWLDELAEPNDNTARDTKSSNAGVP